jgi:hypothetical protein
MSRSAHFSVTAAVALVLGGVAAFALATVIALDSGSRAARVKASASAPIAASSTPPPSGAAAGAAPELEYPLDTTEP